MTPCALYEFSREDIEVVRSVCPEIQRELEEADQVRRATFRKASADRTLQAGM